MNLKINKKRILSLVSVLTTATMLFSTTACTDKTWCAKDSKEALPMGVYIYSSFLKYNQAYSSLYSGITQSGNGNISVGTILDQKIEDENIGDWIKEKAELDIKNILSADKKMEELGLSLTTEELEEAKSSGETSWNNYGATLKRYGISRDSFDIATGIFDAKKKKIAEATGLSDTELTKQEYIDAVKQESEEKAKKAQETKEAQKENEEASSSSEVSVDTSDDAVKDYFINNYTNYSYMTKQFANSNDTSSKLDSEEDVTEQFTRYERYINSKEYTMQTLRDRYKNGENLSEDPLKTGIDKLDNVKDLPEDVRTQFKDLANNTAKAVKSGNTYYLIYKDDINNQVSKLDDEDFKSSVISNMTSSDSDNTDSSTDSENDPTKSTNDIYELLKEMSNSSSDITVNYSGINNYQPSMFENSKKNKK